ncbi:MAG: hypothetical protein ACLFOY_07075 [Desulfatibacillaceae bacterium]
MERVIVKTMRSGLSPEKKDDLMRRVREACASDDTSTDDPYEITLIEITPNITAETGPWLFPRD